ncbi:pentapeptide repeat-containing protein [Lentzea sp. BCCO 10_0798]|uniref:Pentapeptide repeat-containing protein n=1 Tax=Lentzea kristufekii TaxID=3095430 RepID=A0ABU4TT63_9PSEU|nr:pentapeptide repeat-containing protein [Lentzea sp. BCCO 10_0798]MDX8051487.1 pentapeptide repeat-containing protein [Lentzea sp. BCCO 10_0798]
MAETLRRPVQLARTGALVLGGLGVLALYVLAIWRAPEFLVNQDLLTKAAPEQRLPAEHNARLIVISIGGALVVGTGLLYTARNYRLAHRGQVTERFTKALERLGSDELYVRIGGVHALEHVMRDSPDHNGDVVEVLIAFIRDQAPRRIVESTEEPQWMHPPIGSDNPELPREPAPDVQAALTALGKRPNRSRCEPNSINFRDLHLKRAHLEDARLENAELLGAQFEGANLSGAQLQNADLRGAGLQRARLLRAQLDSADLWMAQLQHADLTRARLQHTDLRAAQLQGAKLRRADLQHADLSDAQLQSANLTMAQLQSANLTGAQLQGADLTRAVVTPGQLRRAELSEDTILPRRLIRDPSGEIWERYPRSDASDTDIDQQEPTP